MDTVERARQRLEFVRTWLGPDAAAPERASSDAGFRSYWRSTRADGSSAILMDSPPAREDVRPWLALQALFERSGVRVPQVLARDEAAGLLLLEDLGGPTLLQCLDSNPEQADRWFEHAFTQLLAIQRIPPPATLPRYDSALVRRELALFPEWFLRVHLGLEPGPAEQALLAQVADTLSLAFQAAPQGLVHRDFMPRNLMPLSDGVAVLDFQDAVTGPLAYDVLSLFKDAFLSWPQARIDGWIARYLARAGEAGLSVPGAGRFRRDFDLIGVQRHLKVLGIFARLQHRDGKPHYLRDAPRFLAYLDAVLPQYPEQPGLLALHAWLRERVHPRLAPMALPA